MPLDMQPLSEKFGVAITNVDLSKDIDRLFDEIVDVFVKKQVLVFRNQHIEPQHQVPFSRRFGSLEMLYDEDQRVPGFPAIAILSNEKVDSKFIGVTVAGDFWHSDQSYRQRLRSRPSYMPISCRSTAIPNSPTCMAPMKACPITSKSASPVGRERNRRKMPAGGGPRYVKSIRAAAEARGIFVEPSNGAPHLIGHNHEVASTSDALLKSTQMKCTPA